MRKLNNTKIPKDWLVLEILWDWDALDTSWNWNNWSATDVTYVDAERGYVEEVCSFNGSSSILTFPKETMWTIWTQDFYVSWWYYLVDPWSDNYPMLFGSFDSTYGHYYWPTMFFDPYDKEWWWNKIEFRTDAGNTYYSNTSASSLYNWWHHIVLTRISWTLYLYINWNLDNSWSDNTNIPAADEADICVDYNPQRRHWKTWLVRAWVWKWLTLSEIQAFYQEGLRKLWPPNARTSQWFPYYSLSNLENWKVLEISKPKNPNWKYINQVDWSIWTPTNVTDNAVWLNNTMALSSWSISWSDTSFLTATCFELISWKWKFQINPAYITTTWISSTTKTIANIKLRNKTLSDNELQQEKYWNILI